MSVANDFLQRREDNLGIEGEMLWLERVLVRISDKVKTLMTVMLLEMR